MKNIPVVLCLCFCMLLISSCKNHTYNGTCEIKGTIRNYKKITLELFEITQSRNYFISKVEVDKDGNFSAEIKDKEKSIYGISNGQNFIYFINDVPELSIESSEDEFDNYIVLESPQSEQLRQLVITDKKMATEVTLAEKILMAKMVKTNARFGGDHEMLDIENKADERSLELRNYVVNYMDTVQDKLLAVAAASFLLMNEEFNYLELFSKKIENADLKQLQKDDLQIELDKIRTSFASIAPVTTLTGIDRNGNKKKLDSLNGKYVFVNIWASWCYLSRTQVPFIKKAYEKHKTNPDIEFVNIAIDDNFSDWNNYLTKESFDIKYNLCDTLGKNAAILKRFGVEYIPANFLLDKQGKIITSNMKDENILRTIDAELTKGKVE